MTALRSVTSPDSRLATRPSRAARPPMAASTGGIALRVSRSTPSSARAAERAGTAPSPRSTSARATDRQAGGAETGHDEPGEFAGASRAIDDTASRQTAGDAVAEQPREDVVEGARQRADQPRGLGPRSLSEPLAGVDHPLEQQPRGVEVLREPRPAQERDHAGLDGEVGEVAEALDSLERVETRVLRQVHQRLGPHAEVAVVEHDLHLRQHRPVAGSS
jgi:hypothetical protein